MDTTRKFDLRPLLAVAAVALVAATIWAAAALASGGSGPSSSSDPGMSGGPPDAYVQDNGGDWSRGDCPERDGDGGNRGDGGSQGNSGMPSADL